MAHSTLQPADEIRLNVAIARQSHPHIAETAAEDFIAEGLTPDQASERLYDLISEPLVAAKVVAQYKASKGLA